MAVNAFTSNQGTQTAILTDNTGGTAGTVIPIFKMSMDGQGTFTTANLFTGTIPQINTIGTLPNIPGGTIGSVIGIGSVSGLSNIPGGTIGSIIGIGSVSGLSNLPQGSIQVTAGTVIQKGNDIVDANNSSTATLLANGTFTGTATDALGYSAAAVYVYSDQSSAANGVQIQFSSNGTNFNDSTLDTFTAGNAAPNDGNSYIASIRARYFRVVYINGTVNQTAFRLNSVLHAVPLSGDVIPVSDLPDKIADHALLTKASIVGKTTAGGGAFVDVKVNPSGALQVDPANGTVQISAGTINLGTVVNNGGTVAVVQNAGTLQAGANTIGNIGTLITGTILSSGTTTGVGTVSNIGSLGMLNGGTINAGTVQINPLTATNTISHAGTSGTLGIGTLVGTASIGAGTALYPTNYRIIVLSGTVEVVLAFGSQTNGNQVVHHGLYPAGGGIANPIHYPHGYGTTNSPLTYQILSGAGTVSWDVDYFTHT